MEVEKPSFQKWHSKGPKPTEPEERFMSCGFKVSPVRWVQMEGEVERNRGEQREGTL